MLVLPARTCRASITKIRCFQSLIPWRRRLRRLPTIIISSICAVRDPQECCNVGAGEVEISFERGCIEVFETLDWTVCRLDGLVP